MKRYARYISLGLALFFILPLPLGAFSGFFMWTSPFLFLNTVLAGQPLVVMHVTAILVLAVIALRHRWFCQFICPVGVLCDVVSKTSRSKIRVARMPRLNKILLAAGIVMALCGVPLLSLLDPMTIFHAFADAFRQQPPLVLGLKLFGLLFLLVLNVVVPFLWCQRLCPLGGLQDVMTWARKNIKNHKTDSAYQPGRRQAFGAIAGFGLGLMARRLVAKPTEKPLRPPGALPERDLKAVCFRCGNCGRSCPTTIIQSSFDATDVAGVLTPSLSFDNSYCLPECTRCGDVCPSGAIKKFTRVGKKELVIGVARINVKNCALTRFKECDLCKRYCEYDAVVLNSNGLTAFPQILTERCVGCGACVVVCPEQVISVFAV